MDLFAAMNDLGAGMFAKPRSSPYSPENASDADDSAVNDWKLIVVTIVWHYFCIG
jgi:hypothetical protein